MSLIPLNSSDQCSELTCDATFKNHRWGKQAAQDIGWFFQRDGKAFCPDHVPEWVEGWRHTQSIRKRL